MTTFKPVSVDSEEELHTIIEGEIEALENGLVILKHEFQCGDAGIVDFLCKDSGSRLALIEVKLDEDEGALFQALRYYDWVDRNRHAIQSILDTKIDPNPPPRMILIAKNFSDDFRSLSTLVKPEVELFSYTVLMTEDGKRGLDFHLISLPKRAEAIPESTTIKAVLDYITNEPLRKYCNKIIDDLKGLVKSFEKPYATTDYIGFRHKGKLVAYIWKGRNHFNFYYQLLDKSGRIIDTSSVRITQVGEDYTKVINKIKESLSNLGS